MTIHREKIILAFRVAAVLLAACVIVFATVWTVNFYIGLRAWQVEATQHINSLNQFKDSLIKMLQEAQQAEQ